MENKTNELRDIEIEDLKNEVYELNEKVNTLVNIFIDTLGAKALRMKVEIPVEYECNCDEDVEVYVEATMKDVLLNLLE